MCKVNQMCKNENKRTDKQKGGLNLWKKTL